MRNTYRKQTKWNIVVLMMLFAGLMSMATVHAAPGYDQVASSTSSEPVKKYGMIPIKGSDIQDGTYEVEVTSSSAFFKILSAQLTVKDGEMTAVMNMYSNSYPYVYMGTAQEAADADMEEYIPLEKGDAQSTFTISVEALNAEIDCASFSKRREKWYDRKILVDASSLPAEAIDYELPDYERIDEAVSLFDEMNGTDTMQKDSSQEEEQVSSEGEGAEPVTMDERDGEYSIEVSLAGGSGRASVTSPTWLYVRQGKAYAKLLWSSTYYDYMIVDGITYRNETTDGSNSTFTIPITSLDEPMSVIADTTAMGDPLEIEYMLTFYSDTVDTTEQIPQEAAKKVLVIAIFIIVAGGILNYWVKKRRCR